MGLVLAAIAFWLGGAIQVWAGRSDGFRRRSACMFGLFAVALTLDIDGPYRRVDQVVGRPNLADLVSHVAGLAGIYVFSTMLRSVPAKDISARRQRIEFGTLLIVLTSTVLLFFHVRAPVEASSFTARYGSQPATKAYWGLSLVYGAACLAQLGVTVARCARASRRRDVALGLTIAACGGVGFGATYIVLKLVQICSIGSSPHLASASQRLQPSVLAPGMVCLAGGLLLPVVRRAGHNAIDGVRVRRHLVGLSPLHTKLEEIGALRSDQLAVDDSPPRWDAAPSGARERLLRCIVESRDAVLAIATQVTAAEGHTESFDRAAQAASLRLDFAEARSLTRLAVLPSRPCIRVRGDGMRKIDLFSEAKDLIELEHAWRAELREGEM